MNKASKHAEDVEAEIQVLKEMIKSVKLQLKSKDTDIQRLNIKIKRLDKTAEIRENVINEGMKSRLTAATAGMSGARSTASLS